MKLSVVLFGRNDNYHGDFVGRLKKTVESLECCLKGMSHEIILVDYNQVEDSPSLSSFFDVKKFPNMKHIVFSKEDHRNFLRRHIEKGAKFFVVNKEHSLTKGKPVDIFDICHFTGPRSSNAAINSAEGEYILHISSDSIFRPGLKDVVLNAQPNILYRAWLNYMQDDGRLINNNFKEIIEGKEISYAVAKRKSIKMMKRNDKIRYNILKACGDFILMDAKSWREVNGFIPVPLPRVNHSDSQVVFHALSMGKGVFYTNYSFVHIRPKQKEKAFLNRVNYEIEIDGLKYNHLEEMASKEWKLFWDKVAHVFRERVARGEIIYYDSGYKGRFYEIQKIFKSI